MKSPVSKSAGSGTGSFRGGGVGEGAGRGATGLQPSGAAMNAATALFSKRRRRVCTPSARGLRSDCETPHAPALAVIVVDRVVQRAAVIPDRERAGRPAHAAGEFRARLVRHQELDQRLAFLFRHVAKADGVGAADINRLQTGVWT